MLRTEFQNRIQQLVAEDQMGLALTAMLDLVQDSEIRKELILFSSRHSYIRREERHLQQVADARMKLHMDFLDFLESVTPQLPEPIDEAPLQQLLQTLEKPAAASFTPPTPSASFGARESFQVKSVIASTAFVAGKMPLSRLPFQATWSKPAERDALDRWAQAVGRQNEIREISARLKPGAFLSVYGMGGTGKSTLASMIAQQHGGTFPGGVLWAELGHDLKGAEAVQPLLNHWASYYVGGPAQAYQYPDWGEWQFEPSAVKEVLGGHGPLLIVLDDLWDIQVWEALRPAVPAEATVLVTTRDARIARRVGQSIELSGLEEPDALGLLKQFTPEIPESDLLALGKALNFHAQALQIAGSDLRSRPESQRPDAIRTLIRQIEAGSSMGDLQDLDSIPHQPAVAASLQLSYEDIGERMGEAYQQAIRFLGIMNNEESILIPEMAATLWDLPLDQATRFLEVLTARSLLQTSETPGIFRQHALVRSFSQSLLQRSGEEAIARERYEEFLLDWVNEVTNQESEDYSNLELLLPHIFRLGDSLASPVNQGDMARAETMVRFLAGIWVYLLRRPALGERAENWLRAGLRAARHLQNEEAEVVFLNALGNWYLGRGENETAKTYYEEVIPLAQKADSIISLPLIQQNLGVLYMNESQPLKARELFEKAIPKLREAGDAHNEAMALQNLGTVLLSLGDLENSFKTLEEAVPRLHALKHTYGEGLALANLGRVCISLGKHREAFQYFDEALPLLQAVGNLHGQSIVLQNRGQLHIAQGRANAAIKDLQDALEGLEKIGHGPEVRNTRIILTQVYLRSGAYHQAQPLMQALIEERNQDPEGFDAAVAANPGTLSAMALIQSLTGNTDNAIQLFDQAAAMFEKWNSAPTVAEIRYNQGDALIRAHRPAEAEPYLEKARAMYTEQKSPLKLAMVHNALGMAKLYQQHNQEAFDYFSKAYPVFEQAATEVDGTIVLIQNNMALALAGLERFEEAYAILEKVISLTRQLGSPGHLALVTGNFGLVCFRGGKAKEGIAQMREAINILESHGLAADAGGQSVEMLKNYLAQMEGQL